MWNGAPSSSTASAASSAAAKRLDVGEARRRSSRACARSRSPAAPSRAGVEIASTSSIAPELAHAAHHLDPERHRAALALEPLAELAELLARRRRSRPRACGRAGSRGGRRRPRRPQATAIPAEWSSIPTAMLNFLPRSRWPMNPAIGAWTESTMPASRATLAEPLGPRVVHPEPALEVDLAGGVAALEQQLDRRLRALPGGHARRAVAQRSHRGHASADGMDRIAGSSSGRRAVPCGRVPVSDTVTDCPQGGAAADWSHACFRSFGIARRPCCARHGCQPARRDRIRRCAPPARARRRRVRPVLERP